MPLSPRLPYLIIGVMAGQLLLLGATLRPLSRHTLTNLTKISVPRFCLKHHVGLSSGGCGTDLDIHTWV